MKTADLYTKLDETILSQLSFSKFEHPKLLVTFSAVPCAGKTTIAKPLAKNLQALYLENDYLRKAILQNSQTTLHITEINKILYPYLPHLYEKLLNFTNGLWVLDALIDEHYEDI